MRNGVTIISNPLFNSLRMESIIPHQSKSHGNVSQIPIDHLFDKWGELKTAPPRGYSLMVNELVETCVY